MLWNFIDYKIDEILCFILLLDYVRQKKRRKNCERRHEEVHQMKCRGWEHINVSLCMDLLKSYEDFTHN